MEISSSTKFNTILTPNQLELASTCWKFQQSSNENLQLKHIHKSMEQASSEIPKSTVSTMLRTLVNQGVLTDSNGQSQHPSGANPVAVRSPNTYYKFVHPLRDLVKPWLKFINFLLPENLKPDVLNDFSEIINSSH